MEFCIQASQPRYLSAGECGGDDFSTVLQGVFAESTEYAVLIWNRVPVLLSYKYDVSVIFEDILDLLEDVIGSDSGAFDFEWPSDTFRASWSLRWSGPDLSIDSKWYSVTGGIEEALNARMSLSVSKAGFLSEWKRLLEVVLDSAEQAGADLTGVDATGRARSLAAGLPGPGLLYRL